MLVCTLEDSARNIDNTSWGCTYFYIFMNFYLTFEYLTKNASVGRLSVSSEAVFGYLWLWSWCLKHSLMLQCSYLEDAGVLLL